MKNKFAKKLAKKEEEKNSVSVLLASDVAQPNAFEFNSSYNGSKIVKLSCDQIKPDNSQPRKNFEIDNLKSLLSDIEINGQLQPIIVILDETDGLYQILIGERRWRAISLSNKGLKIKAIIFDKINDAFKIKLMQTSENKERVNLDPIEEAKNYLELVKLGEEKGFNHQEIADMLHMSRTKLLKYLGIARSTNLVNFVSNNRVTSDIESLYLLSTIDKEFPNILTNEEVIKKLNNKERPFRNIVNDLKKNLNGKLKNNKNDKISPKIIKSLDVNIIDDSMIVLIIDNKEFLLSIELLDKLKNSLKV